MLPIPARYLTLLVELPQNRDYTGALSVLDAAKKIVMGPFPIAGRSGDELASEHGNSSRATTLPYGDTPLGTYRVVGISSTGPGTRYRRDLFGAHGAVRLQAKDGDAALAEANGRFEILIHGGPLSAEGRLRATSGNMRIADEHLRILLEQLRRMEVTSCQCTIVTARKHGADVEFAPDDEAMFQDCVDSDPQSTVVRQSTRLTRDLVAYGEYTAEDAPPATTNFGVASSDSTAPDPDSPSDSRSPASSPNQISTAVTAINQNAAADYTGSTGDCATSVADAIRAAGIPLAHIGGTGYAAAMGPSLLSAGFAPLPADSTPQPGDVAVIQPYTGQDPPTGHAAMWNGKQWVSDYVQAGPTPSSPYPNSSYRQSQPSYTVYRHRN